MDQFDNGVPVFEAGKEHPFEPDKNNQVKSHTKKIIGGKLIELSQLPFEPVTESENTALVKKAKNNQESFKEGMGSKADLTPVPAGVESQVESVLNSLPSDIDRQVRSMMERTKNRNQKTEPADIAVEVDHGHAEVGDQDQGDVDQARGRGVTDPDPGATAGEGETPERREGGHSPGPSLRRDAGRSAEVIRRPNLLYRRR